MIQYIKDPNAKLDYGWDWSEWLNGDNIVSSTFTASSPDINIVSSTNSSFDTTVWLSGGVVGQKYTITNHIVTAAGREDDRSFDVKIQNR